jgi:hypothetical protein
MLSHGWSAAGPLLAENVTLPILFGQAMRSLYKYNWLIGQEVGYVTLLTGQSEIVNFKQFKKHHYTEATTFIGT